MNKKFGKNAVRTSKYTLLTFLPKNLMQQFMKAPNVYFLVIMFMQMIESISISGGKPAMLFPLAFVVAASMVKDAFEDFKRHRNDDKENDSLTLVFNY